ncbi:hypothetical protein [Microbacterium natoriense]|uniref:hypothetical protein n=1 Tax=Microbacterium natoriense TaxID=284570 RepID=UPI0031CDBC57
MKRLLAKISLGDNRQVDQLVIDDWLETIGHLTYMDAYQAVVEHRQNSTDYLMPGHITRIIRQHTPRAAVTMSPEAPATCTQAAHRWLPDQTCMFCTEKRN